MSQIEEVSIPFTARKHVALTRLSRSVGFISAVSIGLVLHRLPAEKIITAVAVFSAVETLSAGIDASKDTLVQEEMDKESFGRPQDKLEAAGAGLGIGFAAVAVGMVIVKLMKKKEETNE